MAVRKSLIWCAATVALGGVWCAEARACSLIVPGQLVLDPVEQQQDTQPPATPEVSEVAVLPGSHCGTVGVIRFAVTSSDDRTPSAQLGYQLTVVRGAAPRGLVPIDGPMQALPDGTLILGYDDGFGPLPVQVDFDVEIRAVDLAGNVSAGAAQVTVRSPPPPAAECLSGYATGAALARYQPPTAAPAAGSCQLGDGPPRAGAAVILVLLGLWRRASRARR